MERLSKYIGTFLVVLIVFLGLTIPSYKWMLNNVKSARDIHNSRLSPVIFIPGSSASVDRFDSLFEELNSGTIKHSVIKIKVKKDDKLVIGGKFLPRDLQPFFVVGFENNEDGYTNIKKQARWFNIAMKYLRSRYYFNNFSGVGHSNGGLIYTIFLEKYFDQGDLDIKKLITIGTPYNFNESDIEKRTQMLDNLVQDSSFLPKNMTVFSIAGTKNYTDDGIVPSQSVETGKYIFQDQVKNYTLLTVTGSNSEHSDLVQNPQVVEFIKSYILFKDLRDQNNNQNEEAPSKTSH